MIYDFIRLRKGSGCPLYLQLYGSIKENIENGNISNHSKLPSIRKFSEDLSISRTTVENAYNQLCAEGYINNVPQKGYYVQASVYKPQKDIAAAGEKKPENNADFSLKYDFTGKSVDIGNINLKLWKKYIRNILNCDYLITSYGHPQGEEELRAALSRYSYSVRGVCASKEDIVIGAGTQPLLYLICGLIRGYGDTVAMEGIGFTHAEQVFNDCGLKTVRIESDSDGINPDSLSKSNAKILLINPSGNLYTGKTIKMNRRMELIKWARDNECIIIEDDYNGELRYSTRPIPAMQGYGKENVIYLGSFSKLLLPSVRISYIRLPELLMDKYRSNMSKYNQTASKIEQLALGKYIKDGQLERHLRKLRKLYSEKSQRLENAVKNTFKDDADTFLKETSLLINVTLKYDISMDIFLNELKKQKIAVIVDRSKKNSFDLSFSGIPNDDIEAAVLSIKNTADKINRV